MGRGSGQADDGAVTIRERGRFIMVLVAVAVLAIAGTVVVLTRDDGNDQSTKATTTTRERPTTSSVGPAPTTTTAAPVDTSTAVWPVASSTVRYRDPVSAARGFAIDFVGFVDPVIGEFRAGDSRSGEVPVHRNASGPETTVLVRQLGNDGTWWVLGAQTANIQLTAPAALASIASPVTIRGTSTAYEATVNVEVREDGNDQPLVSTFLMGGANGQMGPLEGDVAFATPRATSGAMVLFTKSPEDGRVAEATVVRVAFAPK